MSAFQAALYARVSSEATTAAQAVASQIVALQARVAADGGHLSAASQFVDIGTSGATLVRPALERLRDLIAAGGIDRLYVHSPDRLARKYAYQALLIEEFQRAGVEVVFLNHQLGQSPEDELLLQVQGMVAEYERAKFLERSRRGKRYAAQQGDVSVLGQAPYGYRYIRRHEAGTRATFVIDVEEAQVVRTIFAWIAEDKLTLGAVRRRLHEEGRPTRSGKHLWDHKTLWGMVTNSTYMGEATFGKTRQGPWEPPTRLPPRGKSLPQRPRKSVPVPQAEHIRIAVPAIVSAELFAAVQEQLQVNRRRARERRQGPRYLLPGVLVCAECGYAYYGTTTSGRQVNGEQHTNAYYRCSGSNSYRFGGVAICQNRPLRMDVLDAEVWQAVAMVLAEPERVAQEYQRRLEPASDQDQGLLEAQLRKVRHGIARLIDSYAEGTIEKAEFEPRLARLRRRATELAAQVAQREAAAVNDQEARLLVGRLEEFASQVQDRLAEADLLTRRKIMHTVVKRVEVGAEQINVVFRVSAAPFALSPSRGTVRRYEHYGERVDTRTLHRDMRTASCSEPIRHRQQILGHGREGAQLFDHVPGRIGREETGNDRLLVDIKAATTLIHHLHG